MLKPEGPGSYGVGATSKREPLPIGPGSSSSVIENIIENIEVGAEFNADERVFPRWEEDDADRIPYAVNPLQYLGIVDSNASSGGVFPRWEEDDADHIPYAVNPLQYLGINE